MPENWVHVYAAQGEFLGVLIDSDRLDPAYRVTWHALATPKGPVELESVRAVPEGVEPVALTSMSVTPFSKLAAHVREGYEQSIQTAKAQRQQARAAAAGLVI